MPQLDPTSFISQLFWLSLTFSLLYLVVSRMILPQVSRVLQNRQTRIASDLDKAESMRKDAEKVLEEYEASLNEAHMKAAQVIAEAQERSDAEAMRKREELDYVLQKKLSDAEKKIETAKNKVIEDLKKNSVELTASVVQQITGEKVTKKTAEDAVGNAMKDKAA